MAYQKAGYQDSLQFDPATGIIKYGSYEFLADQVGVKPQTQTFSFDAYKSSMAGTPTNIASYGTSTARMSDDQLRAQFAADVQSGVLQMAPKQSTTSLYGNDQPSYVRVEQPSPISMSIPQLYKEPSAYRNIQQPDPNTYSVTSYDIPSDLRFVNKLNELASNLSANANQGQVTDASRPVGQTGRLGKPNYSRASSILAGEQSPLGGAKTTLGA